jgi:hypothetical protein
MIPKSGNRFSEKIMLDQEAKSVNAIQAKAFTL